MEKSGEVKYASFYVNNKPTAQDTISASVDSEVTILGYNPFEGTTGTTTVYVEVIAGEHNEEGDTPTVMASTTVSVSVVNRDTNAAYGFQGKNTDVQSIKMIVPKRIIQISPDLDAQGATEYRNKIEESFFKSEAVKFEFIIAKGMGKQFDEDEFNTYAFKEIKVLDSNNDSVDGKLRLNGYNAVRRSIEIEATDLEPGKYILLFGEHLKPTNKGKELGANVYFEFNVVTPLVGGSGVMSKVEVDNDNFFITDDLKTNGIITNEDVIAAMYEAARNLIEFDVNEDNCVVYDVRLKISTDGGNSWDYATKENLPKEGIRLELEYPEGTSAKTQDFEVLHMATYNTSDDGTGLMAGDVEKLNVKEGKDMLQVTVNSLSPFMIVWQDADTEAGINDGSAETGDNMNIALYAGIMILALCGGAAVFARRRKEQ
ncbi:MAG: LPXTG cell wall anchor domain-containing protein [Lentihominibacter sp.]